MRWTALFKKTVIENVRDWKIIILTLTFSPFFVFLMYAYLSTAVTTFKVALFNRDQGAETRTGQPLRFGEAVISELQALKYPDGKKVLQVFREKDMAEARQRLIDKSADVVVVIPENFSRVLVAYMNGERPAPARVTTVGDAANARYIMAAAYCDSLTFQVAAALTGQEGPLALQAETIGRVKSLNDFDLFVPSLLALALIMLMFTAAASIIKEKDKGTLVRLRLSRMRFSEFLAAISLGQVIIGVVAVALTFLTVFALGYRTSGSWPVVAVIVALSSLSMVAISLIVAALLRTIFDLMTIGCFPFFILMFFSGAMIPLPPLPVLAVAGRVLNANDILPTTHTISALGKILNFNVGLGGVGFELAAIVALTILYFAIGIWLFSRRHLRPQ